MSLLCLLSLEGCGFSQGDKAYFEDPKGMKIEPLTFVAGTINGSWVQIAAALAERVNDVCSGYPVTVSTGGDIANTKLIQRGEADIGFSQQLILNRMLAEQESGEATLENVRGIAAMESTALYFIADQSLEAEYLGDLLHSGKKLRLGTLSDSDTSYMLLEQVLEAYGLKNQGEALESGTEIYTADGGSLFKAYQDHYFDLLVINESLYDPALAELLEKRESRILQIEPGIIRKLTAIPGWQSLTIPAGTYLGQTADVQTLGMKTVLIANKDVSEEAAYLLARIINENIAFLEMIHQSYKEVRSGNLPVIQSVMLHPGARRYYEETGLLSKKGEEDETDKE
ncbi:MAG: TAXI family TRAP transporter solute-binding subunit [Peptococcaceae bacterium]|nr:TAXI family TRAP transporter solute-binding subunit [Peptococcaceae bacterium]